MVWSAISYHNLSNLLRIEGDLNSNRYVREVLQPEVVPTLQGIPRVIFQQYNEHPHVAKSIYSLKTSMMWPSQNFLLYNRNIIKK